MKLKIKLPTKSSSRSRVTNKIRPKIKLPIQSAPQVLARKSCANIRDDLSKTPNIHPRKTTQVLARYHAVEWAELKFQKDKEALSYAL